MRADAKPTTPLPPLPRGARPATERGERIWRNGAWRSPAGVERIIIRERLRQRSRRDAGAGR